MKRGWLKRAVLFSLICLLTERGRGEVGVRSATFKDTERGRELITLIWYPALSSQPQTKKSQAPVPQMYDIGAVFGASPRNNAKLPLVILSHGSGGMPASLSWLGSSLAARGFLVAAPTHPGDSFENLTPEGTYAVWNRPLDVSFVLSALLKDPEWKDRIDRNHVGVAGFSMGGYTALAIAGADFSREKFRSHCRLSPFSADCRLTTGLDLAKVDRRFETAVLKDPRVKAAFAVSPFGGPGMTPESLSAMMTPVTLVGVKDDEILSYAKNAEWMSKHIPGNKLIAFEKGKHFLFVGPCSETGKKFVAELCGDLPGVDRGRVQKQVSAAAADFFSAALAD